MFDPPAARPGAPNSEATRLLSPLINPDPRPLPPTELNKPRSDAWAISFIADSATFLRSSKPNFPVVIARARALSIMRPARPAPETSGPSSCSRIVAMSRANPAVSARTLTTSRSISSSMIDLVVRKLAPKCRDRRDVGTLGRIGRRLER
jgi:hypothetical protein